MDAAQNRSFEKPILRYRPCSPVLRAPRQFQNSCLGLSMDMGSTPARPIPLHSFRYGFAFFGRHEFSPAAFGAVLGRNCVILLPEVLKRRDDLVQFCAFGVESPQR